MIKQCLFILICLILLSCNKPHYDAFSDKDLDFVTYYSSAQKTIKFIDTTGTLNTWRQTDYDRSFHELAGEFYGSTGHYQENFRATYIPETGSGQFYIAVRSASFSEPDILTLSFNNLSEDFKIMDLNQEIIPYTINGKTYTKVYNLKMYFTRSTFRDDSAIVLFNRDYGLIQLKYSNNKVVTRAD